MLYQNPPYSRYSIKTLCGEDLHEGFFTIMLKNMLFPPFEQTSQSSLIDMCPLLFVGILYSNQKEKKVNDVNRRLYSFQGAFHGKAEALRRLGVWHC